MRTAPVHYQRSPGARGAGLQRPCPIGAFEDRGQPLEQTVDTTSEFPPFFEGTNAMRKVTRRFRNMARSPAMPKCCRLPFPIRQVASSPPIDHVSNLSRRVSPAIYHHKPFPTDDPSDAHLNSAIERRPLMSKRGTKAHRDHRRKLR